MNQLSVQEVIQAFGGTQRAVAIALGVTPAAVFHWTRKGQIPELRQYQIAALLAEKASQDGCQ